MKLGAAPPADVVASWRCVPVTKTDAGARPVGTPDCCCERVSQDLDLVAGSAGGAPVSSIGGGREVAMDIVHPRVAGIDVHKKVVWVAVRLPGQRPGERTVTVKRFKTFWRSLQQDGGLAVGAGRHGRGDGKHRGVLVAGLPCAGRGRDRGVRVQRGAHAQRPGPQNATWRTASGSPSCTSTGCCGPASSPPRRWPSCGPGPATARS